MKQIPLTKGKFALVDDEDYKYLNQWEWRAHKEWKTFYAIRNSKTINKKRKTIQMHRVIMNPPNNMQIDHIDHNGLNNQKVNLRIVTNQQNQMNQQIQENTSSKFKGVYWVKRDKIWGAYIRYNQRLINLGHFKKEIEAAIAYNQKAIELFGEYAYLNPIPDEYKDKIPIKNKKRASSKYTGVSWHKRSQKWRARIYKNKKQYYLGLFETEEQAHKAILEMKNSLFF